MVFGPMNVPRLSTLPSSALHADRVPQQAVTPELLMDDARAILDAARMNWIRSLSITHLPEVDLVIGDLPNNQLAEAAWTEVDASGRPTRGQITVDNDAAGWGWFVDRTPGAAEEFDQELRATVTSSASGHYDLLTVLGHEYGHLLGFTQSSPAFAAATEWDHAGHRFIIAGGQSYKWMLLVTNWTPALRLKP